jgi:hypothetical protein
VQTVNEATPRTLPPAIWVLLSSLAAAGTLAVALFAAGRPSAAALENEHALNVTPERAADSFIEAYQAQSFDRAADFATGTLQRALRAKAKHPSTHRESARVWVLEESHLLRQDKLRFLGVLVQPDEDESAGCPLALTVVKRDAGYYVEDLHWPKGPPQQEREEPKAP